MKTLMKSFLVIAILALATPVLAKPALQINLKAETETVETADGKEVVKRVPTEVIASGQTVVFTLEVVNSGDQAATKVKVSDPVPEGTTFIAGSTFGNDAEATFSIDGGKSYSIPQKLTYRVDRGDGTFEERIATPDQYTDIQWLIETVPAGGSRSVGFKALVK